MALIPVTFANGRVIKLTRGEINAIEKYARMNGTDPKKVQHHPSRVSYVTTENLVRKGLMRRDWMGLPYFVEGLLEVQGPSLYTAQPFSLGV